MKQKIHKTHRKKIAPNVSTIIAMVIFIVFAYSGVTAQSKGFTDTVILKNQIVKADKIFISKTGIELISISAGEFTMGCCEGDSICNSVHREPSNIKSK